MKPGYKQTEVGVIPEDWSDIPIREMATKVGSGITPSGGSTRYKAYGRPFVRSQNVGWGHLNLDELAYIDEATHAGFLGTEIQADDVLLNITGASIGRSSVADSRIAGGNVNQHVCIIRPDKFSVLPDMLSCYLISDYGQRQIDSFQAGGNRQGLNFQQVSSVRIPIPPLPEQTAIASALGDADEWIAALEKLIEKKRMVKQGAMQELLSGKRRLPGFSGEWEEKRLGEIADLYQPMTISASQFTEAGFPVYGANGVVGYYNQTNHQNWQVTVTCRGSTCGTVNRTVDKCWITGNAMVLNCDHNSNIDKVFFYYVMCGQNLDDCITGTGQPQIVRGPLAAFEIDLPMILSEQTAIAAVLSDMDEEIGLLEEKLAKARLIKRGMMQALLTGRVRLQV
jgi:type I restriction enzyme S subunit